MHTFARFRFKYEIFLWMLVICLLQAALVAFLFYRINTRTFFENEKENLAQLLNVVNQDLESRMEAFNSLALDVVINDEIKTNLNEEEPVAKGRAKSIVEEHLSNKVLSAAGLLDLSIIDKKGTTYSTRAVYSLPRDFILEETQVYQKALPYNGALVWLPANDILDQYAKDPNFFTTKLTGLRAVAIIKDYTRIEVHGLLMVSLQDSYFSRIYYSNKKLDTVKMYLVSPDKAMVLPVAGSAGNLAPHILDALDFSHEDGATIVMPDEQQNVVSYRKNHAMGWYLVSVALTADIHQSFSSIVKAFILTLLFSMLASMVLAWASTLYTTRGIQELASTMQRVQQGDFDVRIETKRKDEIGWLSEVFNTMVGRIKKLIDTTFRQELLAKEAQFKSLQAQIHPHFLYNTLDMIHYRLLSAGQAEIGKSVQALGKLVRYAIHERSEVTLSQELGNCEDYLILRQSNKDPFFAYSFQIVGTDDLKLPRLTLQPLVENAIIHGFGRRQQGNSLLLKTYPTETGHCIAIEDNGVGIEPQTVMAIQQQLQKEPVENSEHIGIANVNQRIKYMYGENSGITIASTYGLGTIVTVTLQRQDTE